MTTIVGIIIINHQIAERFNSATGKTRALFGLIEINNDNKYFFLISGIIAAILAIKAYRRGQRRSGSILIGVAVVACLLVFLRLWKYMIEQL
jgi:hypothetical protein